MKIIKFLICIFIFVVQVAPVYAAKPFDPVFGNQSNNGPKAWSYTNTEMYQMATNFRKIRAGKELKDIKDYLKASEFKGYVAAILDDSNKYNKCTRKHVVNDIALRAAVMITSIPLNRSGIAATRVHIAVLYACDEKIWKKKKIPKK